MRKVFIPLFVSVCVLTFVSGPAFAGDKQRHRWEGVAIGVGAAVLGHAILSEHRDEAPARVKVIHEECHYRECEPPRYDRGRGKGRKVWVPPVYERVWNPGHYDCHGDWVPGHWITVETEPGYWTKKKDYRRACR